MPCEPHNLATARPTPLAAPVMRAFALERKTETGAAILNDCMRWKQGNHLRKIFQLTLTDIELLHDVTRELSRG